MNAEQLLQRWEGYQHRYRQKRILIFGVIGLCFALMVLYAWSRGVKYQAKTVFHPSQGSAEGALNPIASILGGDLFMINGEMKGILASRSLSEKVASDSVLYKGKNQTIAEAIHSFNRAQWSLGKLFKGNSPDTTTLEAKVISIGKKLRTKVLVTESEYGFLEMLYAHPHEGIAQRVSESYIANLEQYYYDQKTEKARRDLAYYDSQAIRARAKLDSAQAYIAAYQDFQRQGVSATGSLRYLRKQSEVGQFDRLYQQWSSQLAQARAQLQSNTPVVQVLDSPLPPFKKEKSSKVVWGMFGIFLGFCLCVFLFFRKMLWADIKSYIVGSLDG
ncbi:MAG: hypothetical protein AB8F95_20585 [Bacteroidia bacterium]